MKKIVMLIVSMIIRAMFIRRAAWFALQAWKRG
jgi:hypothetical protein